MIFNNFIYLLSDCAGFSLLCGLFSSCGERGSLSSCSPWAFHYGSFFCFGAQALELQELQRVGSVILASGL